jgi:predicted nuclease of restriction endonuclease-like (RecB) superfamily
LYLRSAVAKKPEALVIAKELSHLREGGQMTPDLVFRDPYMLDFSRPARRLQRARPGERHPA